MRQTSVFVRFLTPEERQQMEAGLRSSAAFLVRRCQSVLASAQGTGVPRIARQGGCSAQTVRTVVHACNTQGVACLPRGASRPPTTRALGERRSPAAPGLVTSESTDLRPPHQSVDLRVSGRGDLGPRPPPPAGQPRSDPHGFAPLGGELAAGQALDYQSRSGGCPKNGRETGVRLA